MISQIPRAGRAPASWLVTAADHSNASEKLQFPWSQVGLGALFPAFALDVGWEAP